MRPFEPLRASLHAVIGSRVSVKVDRGEGLYVFPTSVEEARWILGLHAVDWFVERVGPLLRATPGWSHLDAASEFVKGEDDEFARLCARHRQSERSDIEMRLFIRAVKGYELGMTDGELRKLDRDMRAAAALALRQGGSGGGLYGIQRTVLAINREGEGV